MKTRAIPMILALCALLAALPALAAKQFDFRDITLENGLRVVTLEDFSAPIVAVQVWYGVGSKNEDPNRQGFAHMFEHMMFRGTDVLGPEEHFELIRATGGNCNAFTSFDYTAYINELPANQLELALWLEAERMMFLKVDQEGFDTERKVVEEERRMGLNEPYGTVAEKLMPVLFTKHPYQWTPIGKIPHLRAAPLSDLQHFWDEYYVPANATLVIVGAVKHAEAQRLARKYMGWLPSGGKKTSLDIAEPAQTEERSVTIEEPFGPVPLVGFAFRGVSSKHPDAIPLELLMGVLGGGESSRLYQDLVKEKKVCTQVMADIYTLEDDGLFGAGAALMPGADLEAAAKAIEEHLERVKQAPVSPRELEKVKNQMRRSVVTDQLTVASKAMEIGRATTIHGDPEWLNGQLKRIEDATAEDLLRVAREYIKPENRTVVRVLPKPGAELPPDDDASEQKPSGEKERSGPKIGVQRPEDFPTTPPVKDILAELPQAPQEERVLKNGLKAVVIPNHEAPFVTVMLGLKYGAWAEDPASPGAANVALEMLTKGTQKHTAAELAEIIEFNALTLSGNADMDTASVTATGLADKLPLALELMAEVVLTPTFPENEFKILQEQLVLSLSIQEEDPGYIADRELRRRLYGNHPYARTVRGELADARRLTPEIARAYWAKFARPDAAVLYIAGDTKPGKAFKLAEEFFGKWEASGEKPDVALPPIPPRADTHIYIVDKPGAVQSQIRVGQDSINRHHPDYHYSRVFTQIFGGSFGSRLNKTIRIERGLTYGARGGFMPQRFTGDFTCSTFTKTESTAETVQAIIDVVDSMRANPPTGEEIETAKSYLAGSFPSQLETPRDYLDYAWIIEYNDLPKDYLNQALKAYQSTETEDVRRVAELVDNGKLTIVVTGEAGKIKADLEKIAPVTVIQSEVPKPESQEKNAA